MSVEYRDHWLLNKQAGWRAAMLDGMVAVEDGCCLQLQPLPGSGRPLIDGAGTFGGLSMPTGLAVDLEDRVYILDGGVTPAIKRYDPCTQQFETLSCIAGPGSEPRQARDPHGLAISCRSDLYLADTGNRRVQIFALKSLPLRAIWGPWRVTPDAAGYHIARVATAPPAPGQQPTYPAGTWQPWDIALSDANWAFVSDYANGLIHRFDPHGHWRGAFDGSGKDILPLVAPTALALDATGRLYVIQEGKDYVNVYDSDCNFLERVGQPDQVKGRFCPMAMAVDSDGNLLISDRYTRCVYLYCRDAGGCLHCAGLCPAFASPEFQDSLAAALAFDRSGAPLLGDVQAQLVARLQPKAAYVTEAHFLSEPLDSGLYRCPWHRVILSGCVPAGTMVRVDTFTSEAPKSVDEIRSLPEGRWATNQIDAQVGDSDWDCLIQSTPGRYLWLRLTLLGEGSATPSLQTIRVYYPRASSIQYLPGAYQQDTVSREFLDRFLSIFDTILGGIGREISMIARLFDPMATPAGGQEGTDFLTWLAGWMGLALDRHWPEVRRRQLLQQAYRMYNLRGTPEGLRLHIELYTGLRPQVLEHYKVRRWQFLNHTRLGDAQLWGADIVKRLQLDEHSNIGEFQLVDSGDPLRDPFYHAAHQFTVFVSFRKSATDLQRQTIERIIEMAKPAHTMGQLRIVEPRLRIGVQSCIGVDTVIAEYPDQVIMGEGKLGYDTLFGPSPDESGPPTMRIGERTRIGSNTLLD